MCLFMRILLYVMKEHLPMLNHMSINSSDNESVTQDNNCIRHATFVGVADPTSSIPPGYVFLPGFKKHEIPKYVFLTRSPCSEASDGMVVRVVCDDSEMTGLSGDFDFLMDKFHLGVVIFPLGLPSMPSKINDSDLDGDLFFAIWDESILGQIDNDNHGLDRKYVSRVDEPLETQESWKGSADSWFSLAQESLVSNNRSYDINLLVSKFTRFYKEGVKLHGVNSRQAKVWGQAWKVAMGMLEHTTLFIERHLLKLLYVPFSQS